MNNSFNMVDDEGQTAFHIACKEGHLRIANILVQKLFMNKGAAIAVGGRVCGQVRSGRFPRSSMPLPVEAAEGIECNGLQSRRPGQPARPLCRPWYPVPWDQTAPSTM